jgi:metal-responsive CopG/Arc/MetJ family transcriptional regulator
MNRVKISVTVDPTLLKVVDDFIERHEGVDRSKVIDQALSQWSGRRQAEAMVAQYSSAEEPASERHAWRSTRRAAATKRLRRA